MKNSLKTRKQSRKTRKQSRKTRRRNKKVTRRQYKMFGGDHVDVQLLRLCFTAGDNIKGVIDLVENHGANVQYNEMLAFDDFFNAELSNTPLMSSVVRGNVKILKYLIERGANPNDSVGGSVLKSPKFAAVRAIQPKSLAILIAIPRVNVNEETEDEDFPETLLHFAVGQNNIKCVSTLLRVKEVDVNKVSGGKTPLHLATSTECVSILLGHKANIDAQDELGRTALRLAAERGLPNDIKIARLLVKSGAKQEIRANDNKTPLMIATENDNMAYRNAFDRELILGPINSVFDDINKSNRTNATTRGMQIPDLQNELRSWLAHPPEPKKKG